MLLAIDPGKDTGWAAFDGRGQLDYCGLGQPPAYLGTTRTIIERPQVYPGLSAKQANDLITLAIMVGEYSHTYPNPELVLPHKWKGNVPKDIHHARIWAKLDMLEQRIVSTSLSGLAPSKRHNVMDAIGLGLYALNRMRP